MKKKIKEEYISPDLQVLDLQVEQGFASSGDVEPFSWGEDWALDIE